MATSGSDQVSNGQRAFWMVLIYSLFGPLLGGLAGAALFVIAVAVGLGPGSFANQSLADAAPHIAPIAITAFIWSAIPAIITALSLVPFVLKSGTITLFMAGAMGVIAFTLAIVVFPFPTSGMQPVVMFIAGVLSVIVQQTLIRGGIILEPQPPQPQK